MPLIPNMSTAATNRLVVYLAISLLVAVQDQLTQVRAGELTITGAVDWMLLTVNLVLPPLIVLRAFMDKSVTGKDAND